MQALSVVIITLNEAKNLPMCLQALDGVADEIIVVDSFSTDNTVAIAEQYGAKVYQQKWLGYAKQKNYANSLAQNAYILSLDADEVLSDKLRQSILAVHKWEGVYAFSRLTNYCGSWIRHSGWYPDRKIRIFPRDEALWEGDFVHETLSVPPHVAVHSLAGDLLHYSYHSHADHYKQIDKYSTLHAQAMHARGQPASWIKRFISPVFKFFKTYFLQLGFLDGSAGYYIAKISAIAVRMKYKKLKALNSEL